MNTFLGAEEKPTAPSWNLTNFQKREQVVYQDKKHRGQDLEPLRGQHILGAGMFAERETTAAAFGNLATLITFQQNMICIWNMSTAAFEDLTESFGSKTNATYPCPIVNEWN